MPTNSCQPSRLDGGVNWWRSPGCSSRQLSEPSQTRSQTWVERPCRRPLPWPRLTVTAGQPAGEPSSQARLTGSARSAYTHEQSQCYLCRPVWGTLLLYGNGELEQLCSWVWNFGRTPYFLPAFSSTCISGPISIFQCLQCIIHSRVFGRPHIADNFIVLL